MGVRRIRDVGHEDRPSGEIYRRPQWLNAGGLGNPTSLGNANRFTSHPVPCHTRHHGWVRAALSTACRQNGPERDQNCAMCEYRQLYLVRAGRESLKQAPRSLHAPPTQLNYSLQSKHAK